MMTMIFVLATFAVVSAREFLSRNISVQEVEDIVRIALSAAQSDQRYSDISSILEPTFHALPKNEKGLLETDAIEYLVQSYFAKEHGWHINGVGSRQSNSQFGSQTHLLEGANIFQTNAPAVVGALLKAKNGNRGFTIQDSIAMVEAIEHLVLRESQLLLDTAYELLKVDYNRVLSHRELYTIMAAYALLFENKAFAKDLPAQVKLAVRRGAKNHHLVSPVFFAIETFNYNRRNSISPFSQIQYKWDDVVSMTLLIHRNYGKELNHQCLKVKSVMMDGDTQGTGRVTLHDFYNHPPLDAYVFGESREHLRTAGVLDESVPSVPRVMIANYMYGPTNCLVNSGYFSLCCISMCEKLMTHLEGAVQAPSAGPERILEIMNNSIPFHDEINISDALASKLHSIADQNQGEVPIYGRLFSQWMHFAFPTECPYPAIVKNSSQMLPSIWKIRNNILETDAGKAKIQASRSAGLSADDVLEHMWDDLEIFAVPLPQRGQKAMTHILLVTAAVATVVSSIISMARHAKGMVHHIRTSTTKCGKHMV